MGHGKNRHLPEDDDGRTIANMNVDGMPWYTGDRETQPESSSTGEPLTKEQSRAYTWAAVKAGLLVVLIFAVVFAAFIAFCDFIWFK